MLPASSSISPKVHSHLLRSEGVKSFDFRSCCASARLWPCLPVRSRRSALNVSAAGRSARLTTARSRAVRASTNRPAAASCFAVSNDSMTGPFEWRTQYLRSLYIQPTCWWEPKSVALQLLCARASELRRGLVNAAWVELVALGRHAASSGCHEILKRVAVRRRTHAGDGRINRDPSAVAEGERLLTDVVADSRCQRAGSFMIRVVQERDEFVAAVAEKDIRHPQASSRLS